MAEMMMFQPGKAFMDSYNQGKAGNLAKIAMTDPTRRQSALADLAGLDPQTATSMKKEFDAQEQGQLKTFATAFLNTPDDLKPQMYGRAKEMWRPRFQALGSDIPDDWKQAMPTIQALAGVGQQQPPAKVLEAQYFAKEMGLDKDPKAYAAYMRKVSGFDGDPAGIKIHSTTGVMHQFRDGGVDIYDWNTGKWNFVRGPNYVTQQNPQPEVSDQNPPPQTGGQQPPPQMAGADPKATFQTLANRYGAQITSVNRTPEQNARVGGVANSFHLTGQAGDFVVPQQNKAQFMAEAKAMGYEAIDEGDHIHLEPRGRPMAGPAVGGAPSAPPPSPNNPFAKKGYQMATAEQKAAFGIPPDVPAQIGPDGQVNVISLPKDDKAPSIANESNIRKEFASQVKPHLDTISAYKRVEAAATNPSAGGDMSMIFAYMKMLDPGSVVREGEFANAQNAAGVPDQVLNIYNRLRTGQRLNDAQRADFLNQARKLKMSAEESYKAYEQQYTEIARQYEIPVERIIVGPSVTPRGGTIDLNSPDPLGILK